MSREIKSEKFLSASPGDVIPIAIELPDGTPVMSVDVVTVDKVLGAQVCAYVDILLDLQDAIAALKRKLVLQSPDQDIERKSLLANAVISYGRCFVGANGRKVVLNRSLPWIDSSALKCHDALMELRHQHFAHSGVSPYRKVFAHLIKSTPLDVRPFKGTTHHKIDLATVGDADVLAFIDHMEPVRLVVSKKIDRLFRKIELIAAQNGIQ